MSETGSTPRGSRLQSTAEIADSVRAEQWQQVSTCLPLTEPTQLSATIRQGKLAAIKLLFAGGYATHPGTVQKQSCSDVAAAGLDMPMGQSLQPSRLPPADQDPGGHALQPLVRSKRPAGSNHNHRMLYCCWHGSRPSLNTP